MSRPIHANIIIFIRTGAWTYILCGMFLLAPSTRNITSLATTWIAGGIISSILGYLFIKNTTKEKTLKNINWKWILSGIKISFPLFIATLAIRGIFTLDRYYIEAINSLAAVAAYSLFSGIANSTLSLLDSGVFSFTYPKLIAANKNNDPQEFKRQLNSILKSTTFLLIGFSAACLALINPILVWVGKSVYIENIYYLYLLLVAYSIYAISMCYHYALYALEKDKKIIISHISGFILFISLCTFLTSRAISMAAPISLILSFLYILIFKYLSYISSTK